MPKETHTTAAYHHERAAKSHRAAAQQISTGAHAASLQHSAEAVEHSAKLDTPLCQQITNDQAVISTDETIIGSPAPAFATGASDPISRPCP